jgi:hypothetical protein
MNNKIEFETGEYGTRAVVKSTWHENYTSLLLDKGISELELNHAKGWYGSDVNFLQSFPALKSFTIIDFNAVLKSINAVHYLSKLKVLNISTYCKTPIDFNSFPNLEKCGLEWRNGSESLFNRISLNKLFLNSYNKNNSYVFSPLTNLKDLTILNAPLENLLGLAALNQLKYLRIGNLKKIVSLHGIGELSELEELKIQRCKGIRSIIDIVKLKKLKRLLLLDLGDIETIKGIENLTELDEFLFYESTNIIDGDLFPLLKIKKLSNISFRNRKHYTHNKESFRLG